MPTVNAVALVIALASLVISVAALWATALKKANIALHYTRLDDEWSLRSWRGVIPNGDNYVEIALYAHNSGANAGILEALWAESTSTFGGVFTQPIYWHAPKTSRDTHPANYVAAFPLGIEAGEIAEFYLLGRLSLSLNYIERAVADEQADRDLEDAFARQLFEAKPLTITVRWRYARPVGAIRALLGSTQPTTATATRHIEIPVDGLRDTIARSWENHAPHQDLAARAVRLADIARTGSAQTISPEPPS
jgi:hypothetical protein